MKTLINKQAEAVELSRLNQIRKAEILKSLRAEALEILSRSIGAVFI